MKRLAIFFLLIGCTVALGQPQLHFLRLVNNWPTIELYMEPSCNGKLLYFTDRKYFTVRENGVEVPEFELWCPDPVVRCAASVVFAVEGGAAMRGNAMLAARQACSRFIGEFDGVLDEAAIVSAGVRPRTLLGMTTYKDLMHNAVAAFDSSGPAAVWDGAWAALEELITNGVNPCRGVVLVTTGRDSGSTHSVSDLITFANWNRIRIYTVGVGDSVKSDSLRRLADLTGGRFLENPAPFRVVEVYTELTTIIFSGGGGCIVTYQAFHMDGTFRKVDFTLKDVCNGSVTETKSYRAPRDTSTLTPLVMRLGDATVRAGDTVDVPLVMQQNLSFDAAHPFETATFRVLYDETQLDFVGLSIPNASLFYSMPITVARIAGGVELTTTEPRTSSLLTQLPTLLSLRFKASSAPHADTLCSTISIPSWTFTAGAYTPWLTPSRVCIPGTGISNVETLYNVDKLLVYPEPNPGRFTVRLNLESPQPITMRVRNVLGQIVYETTKVEGTGEHTFIIDLGNVPSGVYVLEATANTRTITRQINVVR